MGSQQIRTAKALERENLPVTHNGWFTAEATFAHEGPFSYVRPCATPVTGGSEALQTDLTESVARRFPLRVETNSSVHKGDFIARIVAFAEQR